MLRGKKPKPTHLKLIEGEKNKDRINRREPKPEPVMPKCPKSLSKAAKKEWRFIAPQLHRLGILTKIDGSALAMRCQAYCRWKDAEEKLAKMGLIIKTAKGNIIQNPLLGIANKAMELTLKFDAEFGMTPSSRSRIHTNIEKQDYAFERLLD